MPRRRKITVLQIDPDELARARITKLLQQDTAIELVAACSNPAEGVNVVRQLEPNVVLLDLEVARTSTIDVVRIMRTFAPRSNVLVLSDRTDTESLSPLVKWQVLGCLIKSADAGQLQAAVHQVAAGDPFFSPELASELLGAVWKLTALSDDAQSSSRALTARQAEILKYVGDGLPNREIATGLGVKQRTVEAHIEQIFLKLRAANRTEAVLIASREGLL